MLSRPVTASALPAGKARIGHGRQTQPTLASLEQVFHAELKYVHKTYVSRNLSSAWRTARAVSGAVNRKCEGIAMPAVSVIWVYATRPAGGGSRCSAPAGSRSCPARTAEAALIGHKEFPDLSSDWWHRCMKLASFK